MSDADTLNGDDEELITLDEGEQSEAEVQEEVSGEPEEAEEETIIQFGDEEVKPPEEAAPQWVRDLRKRTRELERENAALKAVRTSEVPPIEVGDKPTLEGCGYDEDVFDRERDAWEERKAKAELQQKANQKAQEEQQTAWAAELEEYGKKRTSLKVHDFEDAEEAATGALNHIQQAIIVKGADNPAAVIYALGKHPQKLEALSKIHDPVKFAFAVSKLERDLKVTTRRKAPEPEQMAKGSAPLSANSDKHLERLEKEADRTGDRSKVVAYKRQLRAKA